MKHESEDGEAMIPVGDNSGRSRHSGGFDKGVDFCVMAGIVSVGSFLSVSMAPKASLIEEALPLLVTFLVVSTLFALGYAFLVSTRILALRIAIAVGIVGIALLPGLSGRIGAIGPEGSILMGGITAVGIAAAGISVVGALIFTLVLLTEEKPEAASPILDEHGLAQQPRLLSRLRIALLSLGVTPIAFSAIGFSDQISHLPSLSLHQIEMVMVSMIGAVLAGAFLLGIAVAVFPKYLWPRMSGGDALSVGLLCGGVLSVLVRGTWFLPNAVHGESESAWAYGSGLFQGTMTTVSLLGCVGGLCFWLVELILLARFGRTRSS